MTDDGSISAEEYLRMAATENRRVRRVSVARSAEPPEPEESGSHLFEDAPELTPSALAPYLHLAHNGQYGTLHFDENGVGTWSAAEPYDLPGDVGLRITGVGRMPTRVRPTSLSASPAMQRIMETGIYPTITEHALRTSEPVQIADQ